MRCLTRARLSDSLSVRLSLGPLTDGSDMGGLTCRATLPLRSSVYGMGRPCTTRAASPSATLSTAASTLRASDTPATGSNLAAGPFSCNSDQSALLSGSTRLCRTAPCSTRGDMNKHTTPSEILLTVRSEGLPSAVLIRPICSSTSSKRDAISGREQGA